MFELYTEGAGQPRIGAVVLEFNHKIRAEEVAQPAANPTAIASTSKPHKAKADNRTSSLL